MTMEIGGAGDINESFYNKAFSFGTDFSLPERENRKAGVPMNQYLPGYSGAAYLLALLEPSVPNGPVFFVNNARRSMGPEGVLAQGKESSSRLVPSRLFQTPAA